MPEVHFDRYYRYDDLTAILHGYAEEFPNLVKLESIGQSYEGRDLWLVTVTNFEAGKPEQKPALWVDGNIHATEVGGTHPALVEAMGAGRPVLYYDTPENREVAGEVGLRFRFDGEQSLERVIDRVVDDTEELLEMGRLSRKRVNERYRWSEVTDRYEQVLESLC